MLPLFVPWRSSWVLHEDADLLVVDKPEGMSTHAPDASRRDDVVSRLQRWLAARNGTTPESQYLGIHQRLDRDTSGVLLFARRREANKNLAAAFEGRHVEKVYVAVVQRTRRGERHGTLTHELVPDADGRMRVASPRERSKRAQHAVTHWRELARHGDRSLLELRPETGRTHQLRVQCAAEGMPLVGDTLYDGAPAPRLMLHARSLTLAHPSRGADVSFTASVPRVFEAWMRAEPESASLDELIARAADARWSLADDPGTTAFRLAHDGDALPGCTVDLYGDYAVASFFGPSADPNVLDALARAGVRGTYVKLRPKHASTLVDTRREDVAPAHASRGEDAPAEFTVTENGLTYLVRLGDGLSTGIFLDQRENRKRLREMSQGKRVLNLFAYTCPFTVAVAAGGASRTVSVDVSAGSLAWGERNLAANGLTDARHVFVASDVFGWLDGAVARRDRFDLVVLDPPSYSTTRGSRFSAESDYRALATKAFAVLAKGGALLACTNHRGIVRMKFRRYLHEAARAAGHTLAQLKDLPAPSDFPPAPGEEPHLKSALATIA